MNRKAKIMVALLWFLLCANVAVAILVIALSPHRNFYDCGTYVSCLIASRKLDNFGYFMYASVLLSIGVYGLVHACLHDPE